MEGVFDRYWTKPLKRKGQLEPSNNPPKESMQKVGQCRIIVEPHMFEATLFTVREWHAPTATVVPIQNPVHQSG